MASNYQHWHFKQDDDNIIWLSFDRAGVSANTLSAEVLDEFDQILDEVAQNNEAKGLIIQSAKPSGFIAGADIQQFSELESIPQAVALIQKGQDIFSKCSALPIPTLALIKGFCLGGGYELSLACCYRIACDDEKTVIGLPEVKLGIHPGWGGTVRLPDLIGPLKAMPLIMSGRIVKAREAGKLGMVDAVVPERHLGRAARRFILDKPKVTKPDWTNRLANQPWMRSMIAKMMKKKLASKANPEHYPAPFAALELWANAEQDREKALKAEVESIASLIMTETAQNLIRAFFLQENLKRQAKGICFKPQHIHVAGAGVMGGDIAAWFALKGYQVTLQDTVLEQIAKTIKRAHKLFKNKLKRPHLVQAAMDRLQPDPDGHAVSKADVLIEAIFENLDAKQELMKSWEARMKQDAFIATNTSSIPLEELDKILKNPERLLGIHFFNPVAQMQLVEVVKGENTGDDYFDKALAFVKNIGKLPLPVKSSPGFLVNRVLMPYLIEALLMYEEGIPPAVIDKAATEFGMPMGPVELADTVGLDICLSVAEILGQHFSLPIPQILHDKVTAKTLGRKTGEGFYSFASGKPKKENIDTAKWNSAECEKLTNRLIFSMMKEAMACLREGVVAESDLLDAGMIFGTGFAPFRGGPFHYAKRLGANEMEIRMEALAEIGERFRANSNWQELLKTA